MFYFAAFGVALAMTMALIPPLIRFSGKLQLLDQPGERKVHALAIPRVGGVGMVLGALLPIVLWVPLEREIIALLAGLGILLYFGVWDDRGDLDYRIKFLGQILAALVVVGYGGVVIHVIPFFGMDPVSPWFSMPLTVIAIVAVTNSVNLADGLDGLAAGMMLLTLAGIAFLAYIADGVELLLIVMSMMGVIVGFLRFNTYPARIFMGDTGSQFLGFTVVTLLVILTQKTSPALNPALPLLLLGVPLFDTAFVIIKRIYTGRSPFAADKNHIHHQLLALKFDHYEAVVMIYLVQALFVGCAIIMRYFSDLIIISTWVLANIVLAFILVIAGHKHWYAHQQNAQSFLARIMTGSSSRNLYRVTVAVISFSLALALVAGPMLTDVIDKEFGTAAAILFVLLCMRLLLGYRFWFVSLRLIAYVTIAFILYLIDSDPLGIVPTDKLYEYLYFGVIIVALLVGSRFTVEDAFQVTPMDFLLILVMAGLVFIPQAHIVEENIIHFVIKVFIMFYAVEFALRSMKSRLNSLTFGTLWALGFIAVKGLILQ